MSFESQPLELPETPEGRMIFHFSVNDQEGSSSIEEIKERIAESRAARAVRRAEFEKRFNDARDRSLIAKGRLTVHRDILREIAGLPPLTDEEIYG